METCMCEAMVLEYQPLLTHSVWVDYKHHRRSAKTLEAELQSGVKSGAFIGYRLITIHKEQTGVAQNASVSISGGEPEYAPRECSDLSSRMIAEAIQFEKCRDRHDQRGNTSAALVAERARQRLTEYASELSEPNADNQRAAIGVTLD